MGLVMSEEKEVLNDVNEDYRADGEYYLKEKHNDGFVFATFDESIVISFEDVSAYIEYGHEWADFNAGNFSLSFSNEQSDNLPHWVYEEFSHIQQYDTLRPEKDYEKNYSLKENRGVKGIRE
jgi:hypothetical protein